MSKPWLMTINSETYILAVNVTEQAREALERSHQPQWARVSGSLQLVMHNAIPLLGDKYETNIKLFNGMCVLDVFTREADNYEIPFTLAGQMTAERCEESPRLQALRAFNEWLAGFETAIYDTDDAQYEELKAALEPIGRVLGDAARHRLASSHDLPSSLRIT